MSTPESAGWYDDPEDETQLRYFDGIIWSDHRVPRQTRVAQPPAAVGSAHRAGADAPGTDVFGRPTGAHGAPGHGPASPTQQPTQPHARPGGTEPHTADGQPLATYGARVGAYLIDSVILMVLNLLVAGWAWWLWAADYWRFVWRAALAGDQDAVNSLDTQQMLSFFDWEYLFIAVGLGLLVLAAYHVGFLATRNATPGKMMLGLTVRKVDRRGRLGVGTAFMRVLLPLAVGVFSLIPLVSYLLFFLSTADLLWPIRDPQRQALHDKIAGTLVVKGKQPANRSSRGS